MSSFVQRDAPPRRQLRGVVEGGHLGGVRVPRVRCFVGDGPRYARPLGAGYGPLEGPSKSPGKGFAPRRGGSKVRPCPLARSIGLRKIGGRLSDVVWASLL